jgi:hypothetical protein
MLLHINLFPSFPIPNFPSSFPAAIAVALTSAEPQRQQRTRVGRQQGADRGYGAPDAAAPPPPVQATYGNSPPQQDSSSLSQAQDHDHSGLDWLLNSVPGQPGTDYPIYGQEALGNFAFECNGQIEGGWLVGCWVKRGTG